MTGRKIEAKLRRIAQFITEIDGLDINFIHVRSKHAMRCPVIVQARRARPGVEQ